MHARYAHLAVAVLAVVLLLPTSAARPGPSLGPATATGSFAPPRTGANVGAPPVGRIVINVTNPTSNATGAFDDRVVLDSAEYADLINANFTNVEAVYAATLAPIRMWIESNASNSSGTTNLWLRLYSLPPHASELVFLDCGPKSSFDLSESGFVGESPLLSPEYAEFDNGWRVFDFYDNFSRIPLSPQWSVGGEWSYGTGTGFSVDYDFSADANITSRAVFSYPEVVDFEANGSAGSTGDGAVAEGIGQGTCTACGDSRAAGWWYGGPYDGVVPYAANASEAEAGAVLGVTRAGGVYSTYLEGPSTVDYAFDYRPVNGPPDRYAPTSPEPIALALGTNWTGVLPAVWTTHWIREYPYVPGILTTVAGSAVSLQAGLAPYPSSVDVNSSLTLVTSVVGGFPPYTYAYSGLPPGCVSRDSRTLACVVLGAGLFRPEVIVTDALDEAASAGANVTVIDPTQPVPLTAYLVATPSTVTLGSSFSLVAIGIGGDPPYSYAYLGLPEGCLTVDGPIDACDPDRAGNFTVTVQVVDPTGASVEANTTVVVVPFVPGPINVTLIAVPEQVPLNGTVTLYAAVTGGAPPYTYHYTGLPSYCQSANVSVLACAESRLGTYEVTVTASGGGGALVAASAYFVVVRGPESVTFTTAAPQLETASAMWEEAYVLLGAASSLLGVVAFDLIRSAYRARHPVPPHGPPRPAAGRRT